MKKSKSCKMKIFSNCTLLESSKTRGFAHVVVEICQEVLICLLILGGDYTVADNLNITDKVIF